MRVNFLTLACALAMGAVPARGATIRVDVSGVTPDRGNVMVALCTSALQPELCQRTQSTPPTGASVRVAFADVPPGRYAVAVFQDLDGTGILRRGKLGIPLEPFGFSNGAGLSRRPKFEAAAFDVGDGMRAVNVTLHQVGRRSGAEE